MANNAPTLRSATDGLVYYGSGSINFLSSVSLQPDGKIVAAGILLGAAGSPLVVVRYNVDGSLDSSFGSGGSIQTTAYGGGTPADVLVQPDGKVVVLIPYSSPSYFGVLRFNADGTPDTTFAGGISVTGHFYTGNPSSTDTPYAFALQGDKLVVVGSAYFGGSTPDRDFATMRLKSDGTLDTTFTGDGRDIVDYNTNASGSSDSDIASSVVIQSDGKIVVAGTSKIGADNDFALVRYNTNGTVDTTFGTSGKKSFNFGTHAEDSVVSVLLQGDGKIVVVGSTTLPGGGAHLGLIRLNNNGSTDTSFGTGGKVVTSISAEGDSAFKAAMQADGKILVVGGYATPTDPLNTVVLRYNVDGSLDSTFGVGGKASFVLATASDAALDIAVQTDGKIVLTGVAQDTTGFVIAFTARLNADGSFDASYGSTTYVEGGAAVVVDDGLLLNDPEAVGPTGYGGGSMLLTRAGGQNADDVFRIKGVLSQIDQGGPLIVDGATIGTVVSNSGGKLLITFNSAATTTLVDRALHQITYANNSEAPPSSVTLTWTFSDGDGTGPLSATADTVIHITGINDAPVITSNGGGASAGLAVVENKTLVTTLSGFDVDTGFAYSLAGTDAGKFVLVSNQLHFASKADFDTHTDANGDGIYDVTVVASDGVLADTQALSVSLIDVPGNKVNGTSKSETIDKSHKIKGKGATAENDKLDGKAGNDTIKGGGDNDTITGGLGKDTLSGEAGHDRFLFKDKLVSANVDLIKDFKHDIDVIALGHKVFGDIGPSLGGKEFYAKKGATEAHDKDDRIIYDKTSGKLYYDEDGNKGGGHGAVHFATLDKHPVIDAGDFLIV